MRRARKKQAEDFVKLLGQAHIEIKNSIETGQREAALTLLGQCQEGAIELGNMIEHEEGEGFVTIPLLESYCEAVYEAYEDLRRAEEHICKSDSFGAGIKSTKLYKKLRKGLIKVENSVKNDITARMEVVFLPYKASMWDSLESIWMAADKDPDCDAYVIPIPYYDRNSDGSFGEKHYEGDEFPDNVPIIHWEEYDLAKRRPDVIYIHNLYDNKNFVTSVDPRFYSWELRKTTDCLVYIPYYSTAGRMSEAQALCLSYFNVDYIVVQCEKIIEQFDASIPRDKFLPLGSPKFDRVINMCKNPPQTPGEWRKRMEGRKVYFYNTSLGGMLKDTEAFLKKMEYVFQCFKGRKDVCLLWRPHPLLESTFRSMRDMYYSRFQELKRYFIENKLGIYDDTPDITKSVALCDAYVGDSGTSVTSLFGVAGKPVFILNNRIHSLPEKDDWRGEKVNIWFDGWGNDRYQVINNQLWFSEKNDYNYKYYMDLGMSYAGGGYYMRALEIRDRIYVLPRNARHLLIIENKKIRKVTFEREIAQTGAFGGSWYNDKYIFLFPYKYPVMIRFNIQTEEIYYVEGIKEFNVRYAEGEWRAGGIGLYGNELVFSSPEDSSFIFVDIDTLEYRIMRSYSKSNLGVQGIVTEEKNLWLLPMNGTIVTCWNPITGLVKEYNEIPSKFRSINWPSEKECELRPFGNMVFSKESGRENIIFSPRWGNMYLTLDTETGKMEKWEPPLPFANKEKNGYFPASGMGGFLVTYPQIGKSDCRIWYAPERRLYDVNIDTKVYKEVEINFDYEELKTKEPGFMEVSEWLLYCLLENSFNSLKDFLDGNITGKGFDRDSQTRSYEKICANMDGSCGENIHQFMRKRS